MMDWVPNEHWAKEAFPVLSCLGGCLGCSDMKVTSGDLQELSNVTVYKSNIQWKRLKLQETIYNTNRQC